MSTDPDAPAPRLTRTSPAPQTGIVHLGPGAFFRAHMAIYTDEAMAAAGGDWGISAVSLQSATARDQMAPQGGLYTAVSLTPDGPRATVIGSVVEVLVAPEDPGAVLTRMAAPETRIVSLTITEKGYLLNPATGGLRMDDPGIQHDLAHPGQPHTAPGFLVEALARRRAAGLPALTVLSCDNLPGNGALVRRAVLDFAAARDRDLAAWIGAEARFPSTMVDRITPATTPQDVARVEALTGFHDPACVLHEPFRQWVIEDDFVEGARPAWEKAGAQLVRDVTAFETMKLRCLNGTHSTLAYLGYLAGYETIAETVADPAFAALCDTLWTREILPTVPQPEGEDLPAYCRALLARYRNREIRHRTWQIAMDGSQKLPQRILAPIRDTLADGRVPRGLCLTVAAWMRYVGGMDEQGKPIDVRDPLAARLKDASDSGRTAGDKVAALLSVEEVFGTDLPASVPFRDAVTDAFVQLTRQGAQAAVVALTG